MSGYAVCMTCDNWNDDHKEWCAAMREIEERLRNEILELEREIEHMQQVLKNSVAWVRDL